MMAVSLVKSGLRSKLLQKQNGHSNAGTTFGCPGAGRLGVRGFGLGFLG